MSHLQWISYFTGLYGLGSVKSRYYYAVAAMAAFLVLSAAAPVFATSDPIGVIITFAKETLDLIILDRGTVRSYNFYVTILI